MKSSASTGKRVLVALLVIILVFSFAACLLQRNGGRIKVTQVQFDTRGASQDADLYYPALTNAHSDKMPCVILSHGGGTTKDVLDTYAIELAKRGFVVLNCSSYGAGLSEQPMYDEDDKGIDGMAVTSQGLYDAINYVRTLLFVDQTKIALVGHSQGGMRVGAAMGHEGIFYTVNDMLLNYMYEFFHAEIKEADVEEDAFAVAERVLNEDQIEMLKAKASEFQEYYDTRVKAALVIGTAMAGTENLSDSRIVQVAGHDVERYMQTNSAFYAGIWDSAYPTISGEDFVTRYVGQASMENYQWYEASAGLAPTALGDLNQVSVKDNDALREAIDARKTHMLIAPTMTHSREFFSNKATELVVQYITQVLDYNNGPLTGENRAIPANQITARWKEYLNTVAMIAMIGFAAALTAQLVKTDYFAPVVANHEKEAYKVFGKKTNLAYWITSVAALFFACYRCNHRKPTIFGMSKFLPQDKTAAFIFIYIFFSGLLLFALLVLFSLLNKKQSGVYGIQKLGIRIGAKSVGKALLLSVLVLLACYATLAVIEYLFDQDYRWWMCIFTEMKLYHWTQMLRFSVIVFPFCLVTCAATNFTVTDETAEHPIKDMVLVVIAGSLGVWLNHFLNMYGVHVLNRQLSEATICGALLMFVPLTVYIARKTYRITKSIWVGSFLNAFFIGWSWVSAISITNTYMGATFLEKLLGF